MKNLLHNVAQLFGTFLFCSIVVAIALIAISPFLSFAY